MARGSISDIVGNNQVRRTRKSKEAEVMSGFYNRTLLRFLGVPTPQPFIDLDSAIDQFYRDVSTVTLSIEVKHGENICRRYADLHLYDKNLREALKHPDAFNGALLAGSYLVSYCSSAKSLLDSVSIALNEVKEMDLPNKKQDFSKKDFWEKFKKDDLTFEEFYKREMERQINSIKEIKKTQDEWRIIVYDVNQAIMEIMDFTKSNNLEIKKINTYLHL